MTPVEAAEKLNTSQRIALLRDENAIEHLHTWDRDELISLGLAARAWPKHTSDGTWRTWLTPFGIEVRRALAPGWQNSTSQ
jgi:hypothetical protein